jgi:hypothetical protein
MRVAIACFVLAAALPAAAAPTGADKSTGATKDKLVCRSSAVTGSRINSSECHLQSEWPEIDAARHKKYEEFNRQLNSGGGAERAISNSPYPR